MCRATRRSAFPALVACLFGAGANATPTVLNDACYVRSEAAPAATQRTVEPGPIRSHLGLRRKATQLVEVDLAVAGDHLALCSVSGIARVRGPAGREVLVLPVRPSPDPVAARGGELCLVRIEATPTAIELSTTEPACRAQGVCGGKVQLHGQRFELDSRTAPGAPGPCFER